MGLTLPGGEAAAPLFTGTLAIDKSGLDLARGADPTAVTVSDAVITLRVNESNDVVTEFPKPKKSDKKTPLPLIKIENAAVKFVQTGREEFALTGVNGTAKEVGDKLDINATVADPKLGNWTVGGQWATNGDTGAVTLESDGPVELTPGVLASIPFVPASTWKSVTAEGKARLKVRIGRVEGGRWTWHVDVIPVGATVVAKALGDLKITNTTGTLVVDGRRVTATDIQGDAAGGKIKLACDLDFAAEPSKMHFDIDAKQLLVDQLPAEWKLRGRVEEGRLNGAGSVDLLVGDTVKPVNVTGKATIKGKLFGGDAEATVTPSVKGNQLQFDDGPTAKWRKPEPLITLVALAVQAPPAAEKPPEYLKTNLKLRNVDLAQLLKKANVNPGVAIEGKVTLEVAAEIPTNSPGTIRNYRAQGKVSLPSLKIEGLTLNQLVADATFREGVLKLEDFSANFPSPAGGGKPAGFKGTATFGVDPRTALVADLKLDRVPLAEVFAAVPSLKGKAAGGLSGAFQFRAPGDALGDVARYDASGELTSDALALYGQDFKQVAVNFKLDDAVATISKLSAKLLNGGIEGSANVPISGAKLGKIDLVLSGFDANTLSQAFNSPVNVAGPVALDIHATIPAVTNFDAARASGTFNFRAPALKIEGATLNNLAANANYTGGVLTLSQFSANLPASAHAEPGAAAPGFAGNAKFAVAPRGDLTAALKLDRVPLEQVFAAIPGLAGKGAGGVSGDFTLRAPGDALGDVSRFDVAGDLHSAALTVYGQHAKKMSARLALKDGVAKLTDAKVDLYDGGITGRVGLPIVGQKSGEFDVKFKGIDTGALTKAIPDSPVKLQGVVNGDFQGTLPPLSNFDATKVVGKLDLDAPKLVVQGTPATKLKGNIGYKPGAIAYDLKGDLLGGEFDVVGEYPLGAPPADAPKPAKPEENASGRGKLRINRVQLERLGPTYRVAALGKLKGVVSLSVDYHIGADGTPAGTGRLDVRGLQYGDLGDESSFSTPVRLTSKGVELSSLNGRLLGGRIGGRVNYGYSERQARRAVLYLEGADAQALFAYAGIPAEGRVSARIETGLGREIRGGGSITSPRAKVRGIDVADLRLPLTWTIANGGRTVAGQVTTTGASGTVAGGRVTGRGEVAFRDSARVTARADFINLNVAALSTSSFGIGRATGSFDLNGNDVRGVDDLNGSLTAKFGDTDINALPVLDSIAPIISPVAALTRFEKGTLTARLGDGALRIEQLALNSKSANLHAEGTVNLNGKLDLDVVYATDSLGGTSPALRLIARNIPAIGPVPVGLIVRISEALANRIIRVRVGGTTKSPTYSVNAARLLSENAARYFAGQFTQGLAVPR